MGLTGHMLSSGVRFSLGLGVDAQQIDYTLEILKDKVALLRSMSPFYNE